MAAAVNKVVVVSLQVKVEPVVADKANPEEEIPEQLILVVAQAVVTMQLKQVDQELLF